MTKQSKAMALGATQALAKIEGSASDPARVNNRLALAADRFNLLSPATSVGFLPEATAVALSVIHVDSRLTKDGGDCWAMGYGMLMPAKHKIMQICNALGISWDPTLSGRIDDQTDPHYCKWRAVGRYRRFDGTWQTVMAHKQMDLRDGSPMIEKLRKDAAAKQRDATNQVTELRGFIEEHAETKAMLRAVRAAAGMKTSFTRDELAKPFVAAQLVVTGRTDDPVLKRLFVEEMLHGGSRAFGPAQGATSALPQPEPHPQGVAQTPVMTFEAPPPVGSVPLDEDDLPPPPPPAAKKQKPRTRPKAPPLANVPSAPPSQNGDAAAADDRPLVCPWGDHAGKSWSEVPEDVLLHCLDQFQAALRKGTAKDPGRMRRHVAAIEAALGVPSEEPPPAEGQASLLIDDGREPGSDDDEY